MSLSDFINSCPTNCDQQWYELLGVEQIFNAYAEAGDDQEKLDAATVVEANYIHANSNREVSVYWPEHCLSRKISSDCTCSLI